MAQLLPHVTAMAHHYRPPITRQHSRTTAEHRGDRDFLDHDLRRWRHSGELVSVITRFGLAGVDGRTIARAIEADTIQRGWRFPDRIGDPPAFLAARLRMLPDLQQLIITGRNPS